MAGGIDWFRWHHGSVTDPKFGLIAKKAGARLGDVLAVWAFVLESASANEERGTVGPIDSEALEFLLGLEEGAAHRILDAMTQRGLLGSGGMVVSWEKRQPKREREDDKSTDRVRAFRERQRHDEAGNAVKRQETPREEESREEEKSSSLRSEEKPPRKRAAPVPAPGDVDAQVWADWCELRKGHSAKVSTTAVDEARKEAAKAGLTLDAFLRVWCVRGSRGLQADWLKPQERAGPAQRATSHAGFDSMNYREGIEEDGSFA